MCRQRSGCEETTFRKFTDNGSECEVIERCVGAQCAVSMCTWPLRR